MRAGLRLGALALAAATFSGCIATQRDVLDLETQTDDLKTQITDLKKTVSDLQANQADLAIQMKQLHDDLGTFTEAARQNQDQMTKLSSKLDDMAATVSNKVASIGTSLTTQQAKNLAEQKAALEKEQQERANSPSDLFNAADVRLALKSYGLAAKGFEDYIQKFPDGALIDVANYKLGQAYYGEKKWETAGRQFALVLEKFPKSELTASARLMYALCLISMRRNLTEAKQYLESIRADFPSSPEAKAAVQHLKKLAKSE